MTDTETVSSNVIADGAAPRGMAKTRDGLRHRIELTRGGVPVGHIEISRRDAMYLALVTTEIECNPTIGCITADERAALERFLRGL